MRFGLLERRVIETCSPRDFYFLIRPLLIQLKYLEFLQNQKRVEFLCNLKEKRSKYKNRLLALKCQLRIFTRTIKKVKKFDPHYHYDCICVRKLSPLSQCESSFDTVQPHVFSYDESTCWQPQQSCQMNQEQFYSFFECTKCLASQN